MRQNGQILPQNEEDRDLFCRFHFFHRFTGIALVHKNLSNLTNIGLLDIRQTAFALVLFHETGTDDTGGDSHGTDTEIGNTDRHDPAECGDGIDVSIAYGEQR